LSSYQANKPLTSISKGVVN